MSAGECSEKFVVVVAAGGGCGGGVWSLNGWYTAVKDTDRGHEKWDGSGDGQELHNKNNSEHP